MRSFILPAKAIFSLLLVLTVSGISAQEYRTVADTPALNKKYAAITLDVARLQSRLVEAQNKTAAYQKETEQAKIDAANSAQNSMNKAQTATSGNTDDTRRAVKEAKLADKRARQAKKADEKEKENQENIAKLNDEISKKQVVLSSLESRKSTILGSSATINSAVPDTSMPSNMADSTAK